MIRFLTAGESHGQALVGIIEGVPAGVKINAEYINHQLKRRQQGYGRGGRMKIEKDSVKILSGIRYGKTIGSPVALIIENRDWINWKDVMQIEGNRPKGVNRITIVRPGHADYSGSMKYQYDDVRNTIERASARETAMRVALCTIVRKFLEDIGIFIGSHVIQIGSSTYSSRKNLDRKVKMLLTARCGAYKVSEEADKSEVRIISKTISKLAINEIRKMKKAGDTLGGVFEIIVTGVPPGLGSYVHYDRKLDAQLAMAITSIPAIKAVEIGDGFEAAGLPGSKVHDEIFPLPEGGYSHRSNRAGGIEGGVTNGENIIVRGYMKPIATLMKPLRTVDLKTQKSVVARRERSDFCAVPAASVIGEAVVVPVIANALMEKFGSDTLREIKKHIKLAKY